MNRQPPASEEAERAALGSMILDPYRVIDVAKRMQITPDVFFVEWHKQMCGTLYEMAAAGRDIDILTVSQYLRARNELGHVGGNAYIEQLIDLTPTAAHAEYYLDIVRQKFIQRAVIDAAAQTIEDAYTSERGDTLLKSVPQRFLEIIDAAIEQPSNKKEYTQLIKKILLAKERRLTEGDDVPLAGLPTPFRLFNKITGGLQPGYITFAGRPSMGKTTLEDCIATYVASQGNAVARVTLDSSREELLARAASRKSGVSLPKLLNGFASDAQIDAYQEASQIIGEYPMFINEEDRDLDAILTWLRGMKAKHDIKLITLDYLQQVQISVDRRLNADDNARITFVSGAFKALWKELKVPMIIISQLSREGDKVQRDPRLSDLRGSGSIEQDSSVVVFLYKPNKKLMGELGIIETPLDRPVWCDFQKQKNGPIGAIEMWLHANYFNFEEAPKDWKKTLPGQDPKSDAPPWAF